MVLNNRDRIVNITSITTVFSLLFFLLNCLGTSFAIKCGGPQLTGSDGVLYEAEDGFNLGSAQFHLSGTQKWAVSKVGMYADKKGDLDIEDNDLAQVTNNSVNPKFFQSARMSPGSLRYYGFGLENGPYTVTLHFAEIGFPNTNSHKWASLAKRVFDIYIQVTVQLGGKKNT